MRRAEAPEGPRLGRYVDLGLVGRGGMAEIRQVWDPSLDRALAMKILRPHLLHDATALARFRREARTIARLQHPSIVPIHELGALEDGRPYYTMKVVRGRTLREKMRPAGGGEAEGWSSRRLVEVLHRVSEAMAFAHASGVLHRDLKPENILLGAFGEVLVVDWGLAKDLDSQDAPLSAAEQAAEELTHAGAITGTPAYMPPEQARGERLGPPADVYALGAMLYEVLAGRPPYSGSNAWMVLLQVNAGPPVPVAQAAVENGRPRPPEALVHVVDRAMAREPSHRYPDAEPLAEGLLAWLEGSRRR